MNVQRARPFGARPAWYPMGETAVLTCAHCGRRTADVSGDPPLCDLARALLAERWPEPDKDSGPDAEAERDR